MSWQAMQKDLERVEAEVKRLNRGYDNDDPYRVKTKIVFTDGDYTDDPIIKIHDGWIETNGYCWYNMRYVKGLQMEASK